MRSHWSEQKMLDMMATAVKTTVSPGHSRSRSIGSPLTNHHRSKSDVKVMLCSIAYIRHPPMCWLMDNTL
jgi:hypothetical protein